MTVAELIEELQELDPELEVFSRNGYGDPDPAQIPVVVNYIEGYSKGAVVIDAEL